MSGAHTNTIRAALADIWERNLALIERRVVAVELAVAELAKASPDAATVELGQAEAHRLAGVLGSFGLERGSELARDLELRLGAERASGAAAASRTAAELRSVVDSARVEAPG